MTAARLEVLAQNELGNVLLGLVGTVCRVFDQLELLVSTKGSKTTVNPAPKRNSIAYLRALHVVAGSLVLIDLQRLGMSIVVINFTCCSTSLHSNNDKISNRKRIKVLKKVNPNPKMDKSQNLVIARSECGIVAWCCTPSTGGQGAHNL